MKLTGNSVMIGGKEGQRVVELSVPEKMYCAICQLDFI